MDTVEIGIPSVDLALFTKGSEQEKQQFVSALGKAYEDIGFVAVSNHGISTELIEKLYSEVKSLFELTEAVKTAYEIPEIREQRGDVSFGKEHAKNSNSGDLKEFWHFGQEVNDEHTRKQLENPDNIICNEFPNFNKIGKQVYRAFENTERDMIKAIAL